MIADHLTNIDQFDADLWKIADGLRANANLASNEYFMPILGLLFLRQATNRYYEALAAIQADKTAGKIPDRPLVDADFRRRRAMMLPEAARYDVILEQRKDGKLGQTSPLRWKRLRSISRRWLDNFPRTTSVSTTRFWKA